MKIFITTFVGILLCCNNMFSQTKGQVFLHLQDGSIVNGYIIEENDTQLTFTYLNDTISIDKILIKEIKNTRTSLVYDKGKYHNPKGFFASFSIGGGLIPNDDTFTNQASLLVGYRFNKKWSTGIGLGYEINRTRVEGINFFTNYPSLFVHNRYYLNDNKTRIFLFNRTGYGFGAGKTDQLTGQTARRNGGFNFTNGVGAHFVSRKKLKFILSIGHYLQEATGSQFGVVGNQFSTIPYDFLISRPVIKFGLEFN